MRLFDGKKVLTLCLVFFLIANPIVGAVSPSYLGAKNSPVSTSGTGLFKQTLAFFGSTFSKGYYASPEKEDELEEMACDGIFDPLLNTLARYFGRLLEDKRLAEVLEDTIVRIYDQANENYQELSAKEFFVQVLRDNDLAEVIGAVIADHLREEQFLYFVEELTGDVAELLKHEQFVNYVNDLILDLLNDDGVNNFVLEALEIVFNYRDKLVKNLQSAEVQQAISDFTDELVSLIVSPLEIALQKFNDDPRVREAMQDFTESIESLPDQVQARLEKDEEYQNARQELQAILDLYMKPLFDYFEEITRMEIFQSLEKELAATGSWELLDVLKAKFDEIMNGLQVEIFARMDYFNFWKMETRALKPDFTTFGWIEKEVEAQISQVMAAFPEVMGYIIADGAKKGYAIDFSNLQPLIRRMGNSLDSALQENMKQLNAEMARIAKDYIRHKYSGEERAELEATTDFAAVFGSYIAKLAAEFQEQSGGELKAIQSDITAILDEAASLSEKRLNAVVEVLLETLRPTNGLSQNRDLLTEIISAFPFDRLTDVISRRDVRQMVDRLFRLVDSLPLAQLDEELERNADEIGFTIASTMLNMLADLVEEGPQPKDPRMKAIMEALKTEERMTQLYLDLGGKDPEKVAGVTDELTIIMQVIKEVVEDEGRLDNFIKDMETRSEPVREELVSYGDKIRSLISGVFKNLTGDLTLSLLWPGKRAEGNHPVQWIDRKAITGDLIEVSKLFTKLLRESRLGRFIDSALSAFLIDYNTVKDVATSERFSAINLFYARLLDEEPIKALKAGDFEKQLLEAVNGLVDEDTFDREEIRSAVNQVLADIIPVRGRYLTLSIEDLGYSVDDILKMVTEVLDKAAAKTGEFAEEAAEMPGRILQDKRVEKALDGLILDSVETTQKVMALLGEEKVKGLFKSFIDYMVPEVVSLAEKIVNDPRSEAAVVNAITGVLSDKRLSGSLGDIAYGVFANKSLRDAVEFGLHQARMLVVNGDDFLSYIKGTPFEDEIKYFLGNKGVYDGEFLSHLPRYSLQISYSEYAEDFKRLMVPYPFQDATVRVIFDVDFSKAGSKVPGNSTGSKVLGGILDGVAKIISGTRKALSNVLNIEPDSPVRVMEIPITFYDHYISMACNNGLYAFSYQLLQWWDGKGAFEQSPAEFFKWYLSDYYLDAARVRKDIAEPLAQVVFGMARDIVNRDLANIIRKNVGRLVEGDLLSSLGKNETVSTVLSNRINAFVDDLTTLLSNESITGFINELLGNAVSNLSLKMLSNYVKEDPKVRGMLADTKVRLDLDSIRNMLAVPTATVERAVNKMMAFPSENLARFFQEDDRAYRMGYALASLDKRFLVTLLENPNLPKLSSEIINEKVEAADYTLAAGIFNSVARFTDEESLAGLIGDALYRNVINLYESIKAIFWPTKSAIYMTETSESSNPSLEYLQGRPEVANAMGSFDDISSSILEDPRFVEVFNNVFYEMLEGEEFVQGVHSKQEVIADVLRDQRVIEVLGEVIADYLTDERFGEDIRFFFSVIFELLQEPSLHDYIVDALATILEDPDLERAINRIIDSAVDVVYAAGTDTAAGVITDHRLRELFQDFLEFFADGAPEYVASQIDNPELMARAELLAVELAKYGTTELAPELVADLKEILSEICVLILDEAMVEGSNLVAELVDHVLPPVGNWLAKDNLTNIVGEGIVDAFFKSKPFQDYFVSEDAHINPPSNDTPLKEFTGVFGLMFNEICTMIEETTPRDTFLAEVLVPAVEGLLIYNLKKVPLVGDLVEAMGVHKLAQWVVTNQLMPQIRDYMPEGGFMNTRIQAAQGLAEGYPELVSRVIFTWSVHGLEEVPGEIYDCYYDQYYFRSFRKMFEDFPKVLTTPEARQLFQNLGADLKRVLPRFLEKNKPELISAVRQAIEEMPLEQIVGNIRDDQRVQELLQVIISKTLSNLPLDELADDIRSDSRIPDALRDVFGELIAEYPYQEVGDFLRKEKSLRDTVKNDIIPELKPRELAQVLRTEQGLLPAVAEGIGRFPVDVLVDFLQDRERAELIGYSLSDFALNLLADIVAEKGLTEKIHEVLLTLVGKPGEPDGLSNEKLTSFLLQETDAVKQEVGREIKELYRDAVPCFFTKFIWKLF